jgi:hypothetical protein
MMADVKHEIAAWLALNPLSASDIDCVTAVMLKILDGKCKMVAREKQVMQQLYLALRDRTGHRLPCGIHDLIAHALAAPPGEEDRMAIHEQRVLAETIISRPVMKQFKSMVRRHGLLDPHPDDELPPD